jgi:hypothetical protein
MRLSKGTRGVSRFQIEPPKREREGELDPVALPEGKPPSGPVLVVPSAVKRQVTEHLLTIEIEGERFEFVVDTGATVLLIKPTISKAQLRKGKVQARGVSGTQLEILGVQNIKFIMRSPLGSMTFIHSFVVCPLDICSAGILGLDFLQRVGGEISLTDNSLTIHTKHFPLSSAGLPALASSDSEAPLYPAHGLITRDAGRALDLTDGWENYESCIGTVELAETVSVPPLSGRIARGRVVRRGDSAEFKAPPNYELMVELVKRRLPGIYLARIVATVSCNVNNEISPGAHCSPRWSEVPLGRKDAERLTSPCVNIKSGSCEKGMTSQRQAGSGERQPGSQKSSLQEADAVSLLEIDIGNWGAAPGLQSAGSSRPVENKFGNHTDTFREIGRHEGKDIKHTREISDSGTREVRGQIIGYVPIQVVNLSLEEITLSKHMCVGIASPTETCVGDGPEKVHIVNKLKGHGDEDRSEQDFESYLSRKLEHMAEREIRIA